MARGCAAVQPGAGRPLDGRDAGAVPGPRGGRLSRPPIESDRLLGVSRTMSWDTRRSSRPRLRRAHGDGGAGAGDDVVPRRGLDGARLQAVLPAAEPAVDGRRTRPSASCCPSARVIARTYDLPPRSRTTIYVNEIAGPRGDRRVRRHQRGRADRRRARDVPQPRRTAVRARPRVDGRDRAGHAWFLAEGATGAFFDLYVLIANPSDTDAHGRGRTSRKPDGSS